MVIPVDVYSTAYAFQEQELKNKNVVVIDVLRAGSTIVTALYHGARGIIPVADMGEATKIAQNLDSSGYLLCGERNGYKIDGYHLGNSPLEYQNDNIFNKTLILNTTNGTRSIARSHLAHSVYIGTFLNLNRIIEELKNSEREVMLICAGSNNRLSLEDLLCAGAIINGLSQGSLPNDATDGAQIAFSLYEKFSKDIETVIRRSNNGEWLSENFGEEQVAYCCNLNSIPVLPVWKQKMITLHHDS